jgi:nucleoside-diphosphate-sugar epimerase
MRVVMRKLLVTGASGFVGGKLVERARLTSTFTVLGLGRRRIDDPDYRSLDLSRPFALSYAPDVVVHAAARSSPKAPSSCGTTSRPRVMSWSFAAGRRGGRS